MAIIPEKKCLKDPSLLLKFIILFACGVFTVFQVAECVNKMIHPPVSTHYHYILNESIKYPCLTICRRPPFNDRVFKKYGLTPTYNLEFYNTFRYFKFSNYSIREFMEESTYNFSQVFGQYGYATQGSSPNLSISVSYHVNRGRCYTFKPTIQSTTFSASGGYFFYLLHDTTTNTLMDEFGVSKSGFDIYLHDSNEILTYEDDQRHSFLELIYLEASEDMRVELNIQEFGKIPSEDNYCSTEANYSKSKCQEMCIHSQVASTANCTLPWLILPNNDSFPECDNFISVRNLINDFRNSRKKYLKNCYCPPSCNFTIYGTSIISRRSMDEKNFPNSIISIYYSTNLVTIMSEVIGYDWNQFLSDIGGSLGFLLGLSVISVLCIIEEICRLLFKCMFKRKLKKQEEERQSQELNIRNNTGGGTEPEGSNDSSKNNKLKPEETNCSGSEHEYTNWKDFVSGFNFYEKISVDAKHNENKKY